MEAWTVQNVSKMASLRHSLCVSHNLCYAYFTSAAFHATSVDTFFTFLVSLATLPTPDPYCSAAAHGDVKCAGNGLTRASHHGSPDTNVPLLVYERSIQTKPPSFAGMCLCDLALPVLCILQPMQSPLPLGPISPCCRRRQKTTSLQHILIF